MNPLTLFFITMILFTTSLIISTNSWFISWVALEINLLSFIPLIFSKKNKQSSEATLKYFIIQAFTSVMIVFSIMNNYLLNQTLSFILLFALMTKMALAPCHQWLPSMIEGLHNNNLFLMLTIQKIGPLILLLTPLMDLNYNYALAPFIILSALVGALGGLSQTNINKIIAYSSIAHMAWLMTALTLNNYIWLFYFLVYSTILFSLLIIINYFQLKKISHMYTKMNKKMSLTMSTTFLSLGGLPPFSGFIPKMIITQELFMRSFATIFILLFSTFLSLFFYVRMFLPNMLNTNSTLKLNKPLNKKQEMLIIINLVVLMSLPLYFLMF